MQRPRTDRGRYPLRVKLAVAAASVGFLLELATFALFMMPMIPLVPVFIVTMLGNGFMLASLVEWAASQRLAPKLRMSSAEPEARARPRGTQTAQAS